MTEDDINKWADIIVEAVKNDPDPPDEEEGSGEVIDEKAGNIVIFLKKRK